MIYLTKCIILKNGGKKCQFFNCLREWEQITSGIFSGIRKARAKPLC